MFRGSTQLYMPSATDAKLDHVSESVLSEMSLGKQVNLWHLALTHFRSLSLSTFSLRRGAPVPE